jgi:UPF0271 protein
MRSIDINCDLGEGFGNDAEIMPFIHSCNIACGGHYGSLTTISETIRLASKHAVKVGAHPSFPDPANFGRKSMQIADQDLIDSLMQQINLFKQECQQHNVMMHHVKLHGALYNLAAKDPKIAKVVIKALKQVCPGSIIYAPYNSEIAKLAASDFGVHYEAFVDRRYHRNLQLVSRKRDDAVITDPTQAWNQVLNILENNKVISVEGNDVFLKADTFCVHGDQPQALQLVKFISKQIACYKCN